MGLFESDEVKLSKYIKTGNCIGIYNVATKNPSAWETCLQSLRNFNGDVTQVIDGFLTEARNCWRDISSSGSGSGYLDTDKEQFCAQSACRLALSAPNVPISTRELLYCLDDRLITKKQRWQLLHSLADDGNEWAETAIAAFYVISTNLNDGLFPADELNYGLSITKKVVQHSFEKYTSSYISRIQSTDSSLYSITYHDMEWLLGECGKYHGINDEIPEAIITLYGFGHICLKNSTDSELALRAINLAELLKQKMNEVYSRYSKDYFMEEEHYYYLWNNEYNTQRIFCQISSDELAELHYRVGYKSELFADTMEDYEQIISHYKSAATSGHPAAMFSLAKVYYSGLDIAPKNEQNAKFWLKKAIDADVVEALQFLNEHSELKEDGVKNISYHAEGDIIQGNSGIIAKDDAVVNRANVNAGDTSDLSGSGGYKFCMYCGEKLPAEAVFCSKCGKKV